MTDHSTSVDLDALRRVAKFLGFRSIAYLLNVSEANVQAFMEGGVALDSARIDALHLLQLSIDRASHIVPRENALSELGYWFLSTMQLPNGGHPFAAIRRLFSPAEPALTSGDVVANCLAEMATDAFPYLLLNQRGGVWARDAGNAFLLPSHISTPLGGRFMSTVCADPDLSRLFPDVRENALETVSTIMCNDGSGGTIQLVGLAEPLLRVAFAWMCLNDGNSLREMTLEIHKLLATLRALARGETVSIPTIICFEGVALPTGTCEQTPIGSLCAISPGVLEVIPPQSRPPVGSTDHTPMGFVLVTDAQLSIKVTAGVSVGNPNMADFQRFADANAHNIQSVSLATSLAIDREPPVAVTHKLTLTLNPFRHGSYSWPRSYYQTPSGPIVTTASESAAIAKWCETITLTKDEAARIAIHRAIRSLSGREQALDSFVDAIIAFESLFGDRDQIALSVATCVSRLLEADLDRRKALFRETKRLYARRSVILHGAGLPTEMEMRTLRDRALFLLLGCFRTLYCDRPQLLDMRANERAEQILLHP